MSEPTCPSISGPLTWTRQCAGNYTCAIAQLEIVFTEVPECEDCGGYSYWALLRVNGTADEDFEVISRHRRLREAKEAAEAHVHLNSEERETPSYSHPPKVR